MSKEHLPPAAIECLSAEIYSRKITPSSIINDNKIGMCIKYKCSRNSSAIVKKELDEERLKNRYDKNAMIKKGDKLESRDLYALVKGTRKLSHSVIGGHTGTHSVQFILTNDFTYAQITVAFEHIANAITKRKATESLS